MTFCDLPVTGPTRAGSSGVGQSGAAVGGDDDDICLSQQLSQCSVSERYSKEVYNVSVDPENEGMKLNK